MRITQHTDFNTINGLVGTKVSNTHYCDYKIKYRSKLETLATHRWYKMHIPRDKISNQGQETQIIISFSTSEPLSDFREITSVSLSFKSEHHNIKRGRQKKKKTLKWFEYYLIESFGVLFEMKAQVNL